MSRTRFGRAQRNGASAGALRPRRPVFEFAMAFLAVGLLAYVAIDRGYVSLPLSGLEAGRSVGGADVVGIRFAVCAGPGGTCVIDGDTIRVDGMSIRIADIDAPEVRNYGCPEELALGRAATARMVTLLNEGPFVLASYERDEDVYGRKLRILERDGHSLGMTLVAEGLARVWDGGRRSWCG
ncbi:thermonuclease family protein [Pelagibacterium limicola]|uniref:thermonuclease family protein n=1 Tax=Pelagibacterium limicola TaxID=2791022 RepID=UPI001FE4E602|nr:thermonuclease family protein [Pelagibacterium limicola]